MDNSSKINLWETFPHLDIKLSYLPIVCLPFDICFPEICSVLPISTLLHTCGNGYIISPKAQKNEVEEIKNEGW